MYIIHLLIVLNDVSQRRWCHIRDTYTAEKAPSPSHIRDNKKPKKHLPFVSAATTSQRSRDKHLPAGQRREQGEVGHHGPQRQEN